MSSTRGGDRVAPSDLGRAMHALVGRLFPLCRSITGNGVRETLRIVSERLPLTVHEVPSGTAIFDWTVPKEWNIRDAYIKDAQGRRLVDFQANNLHVVGYSSPLHQTMRLGDLRPHLHSLPDQPELIPYRTTYYDEGWGFCVSHRLRESLPEGAYEVCIDSTLSDGSLSYGECLLPGASEDEVLIYTHTCHPSLANDNLAGIAVCAFLGELVARMERRYSYRFVFGPGAIGSLAWLSRNQDRWPRIRHGLVAVLLGDSGPLRYKVSRSGDLEIDQAATHVLRHSGLDYRVDAFAPHGYDERQFSSPGIRLPVGRLSRSANGEYREYHTSADNLALVQPDALAQSLSVLAAIVDVLEHNRRYNNLSPFGEPHLGRRGLYRTIGGPSTSEGDKAMLWTLNLSDGTHSLLEIAERAGLDFGLILRAAERLEHAGLLTPAGAH